MKKIFIGLLIISFIGFAGCTKFGSKTSTKELPEATTQQAQGSNLQYYFTKANQHPDEKLIKVIDSSKTTLDIAIYSLTKQSIVDAIIGAKKRGVTVRVMTDKVESKGKSASKELKLIKDAGIPIKINSHVGLMYIKMTIADKKIATTGSYNYTEGGTKDNDDTLVIINDPKVAQDFDNEFESMWGNTKEYIDYK